MMRILVLTDLHGQYGKLNSFLELDPDMVIISGDFTDPDGPFEPALGMLEQIDVPCFAVPGNCDSRETVNYLEDSNAVSLHGSSLELGKITLVGIGGSNPTPFGTPFELSEEEIDEILTKAKKGTKNNVHNILVCHAPPEGTLDSVGDANVGSSSIRKHMKGFDLVCCGHIHDDLGIKEVDGTVIVNPGPAFEGKCAIVTLGDEPKDIRVEILSV
ncbi:metallophosphoesterase [Methanolacinia petrolearia DSM 11571]|uniref:Metallophosphoesterase n=1 Tax=Methanolacinia petrolearia (strain DSM 11571 / OCM 486 / SEBR 4847) TaxID=679926 RepID=E1RJU4_METP4|nr:metallophosphoesterase [Methanolacinia petrolearia]ADN36828.1 metallophosphoesterase [Methanolacinia petrolearia DSM 11571]